MNALKQLKTEILSPSTATEDLAGGKNQQEIEIAEFQISDHSTSICDKAFEKYQVGRKAIYEALALTYIWYEVSKDNKAYIDEMFKPFASQTNSHVYIKALKACLRLDENKQAPTISKYKNVLVFINKQLGNQAITGDDKSTVSKITSIIIDEGGVDACAKAANGDNSKSGNSDKHHLTKEEVAKLSEAILSAKSQALSSFKRPKSIDIADNTLAVGLMRAVDGKFEVMGVTAEEKFVNHLLRHLS